MSLAFTTSSVPVNSHYSRSSHQSLAAHLAQFHYGQHVYILHQGEWILSIVASDCHLRDTPTHRASLPTWDILIPRPSLSQPTRLAVTPAFGTLRTLEQHALSQAQDRAQAHAARCGGSNMVEIPTETQWTVDVEDYGLRKLLEDEERMRRSRA